MRVSQSCRLTFWHPPSLFHFSSCFLHFTLVPCLTCRILFIRWSRVWLNDYKHCLSLVVWLKLTRSCCTARHSTCIERNDRFVVCALTTYFDNSLFYRAGYLGGLQVRKVLLSIHSFTCLVLYSIDIVENKDRVGNEGLASGICCSVHLGLCTCLGVKMLREAFSSTPRCLFLFSDHSLKKSACCIEWHTHTFQTPVYCHEKGLSSSSSSSLYKVHSLLYDLSCKGTCSKGEKVLQQWSCTT